MKIINSVGGRTTLACVLHILSVSLCGSRRMLSAQAQKKCFIYTELIVWLWWNAQTLQSIWHNVCPPPIYISFVACIRMHILSHVIVFSLLTSSEPQIFSLWSRSQYDFHAKYSIICFGIELFLLVYSSTWIRNNSIFPHFVSHDSFSHIYNHVAYRVNSWANEEL